MASVAAALTAGRSVRVRRSQIEAVFTLLTLEHQRIPPTINYDVPDPAIPFDVVPHKARDARVATGMSNSFGFGGQNVSLIMRREVN